jgi:hypothetical protein
MKEITKRAAIRPLVNKPVDGIRTETLFLWLWLQKARAVRVNTRVLLLQ